MSNLAQTLISYQTSSLALGLATIIVLIIGAIEMNRYETWCERNIAKFPFWKGLLYALPAIYFFGYISYFVAQLTICIVQIGVKEAFFYGNYLDALNLFGPVFAILFLYFAVLIRRFNWQKNKQRK